MADFGALFITATTPAPAKRAATVDPDAAAWTARVASDTRDVIALAALNAARVGLPAGAGEPAIDAGATLAGLLTAPLTALHMAPEGFELARLARKASDRASAGKAQDKAYAGQQWAGHVLPGVIESLKAMGVALTVKATAGDAGHVFASMMTPEKALHMTITLPGTEIVVRSVCVLVFTPEGMGRIIKALAKDAGFRALTRAFIAAGEQPDVAAALRETHARAAEIMGAARVSA